MVHFIGFDKCIMTCILHYCTIQNSVTALKILCALPVHPSLFLTPGNHRSFYCLHFFFLFCPTQVRGEFLAFWEVWRLLSAFSGCSTGAVTCVGVFLMYLWGGRLSPRLTLLPSWSSPHYACSFKGAVSTLLSSHQLSLIYRYWFTYLSTTWIFRLINSERAFKKT